jgi:hypothetical protein
MFEEICARDLEGIAGKRRLGIYKDDGDGWLRIAALVLPESRHFFSTETHRSRSYFFPASSHLTAKSDSVFLMSSRTF